MGFSVGRDPSPSFSSDQDRPRERQAGRSSSFRGQAGTTVSESAHVSARGHQRYTKKEDRLVPSEVLAKTDIVEIIGEVVSLRPRGGKGEMIGLCPFHGESHPSFEVNGERGIYSCWSCSAGLNGSRGGDALTFIQRYHNMSFGDALEHLARRAGMPIPERKGPYRPQAQPTGSAHQTRRVEPKPREQMKGEPNLQADRAPIYAAMAIASDVYAGQFHASPAAVEYLFQKRGLSPTILDRFMIGFAPNAFQTLEPHFPGYRTEPLLIDAGLTRESAKSHGRRYDLFRDRMIFGVRDERGQIVAFGGRRMSDDEPQEAAGAAGRAPKYLNSPETAIFSKREEIFGLYEARQAIQRDGYVLAVEGYMDVLGLASRDVENAVACMGTALTEGHVQKILALTKKIVFCFDGDAAGQKGAFRSLLGVFPYLDNDVDVLFLSLPNDQDPDEFVREHGKRAFLNQVNSAVSLPVFWESALTSQFNPTEKAGKDELWRTAMNMVDLLPENSRYKAHLVQIARRLTGRERQDQASTQSQYAGRSSYTRRPAQTAQPGIAAAATSHPTDRLYLAAMKLPRVAAAMRPKLIQMQANIDERLIPALATWQAKFDQAMNAGMSQHQPQLSALEIAQYRRILDAAPSVLTYHLEASLKTLLSQMRNQGDMDETSYLQEMRRNRVAKPS